MLLCRNCPTFSIVGTTSLTPACGSSKRGSAFLSLSAAALSGSNTRQLNRMRSPDSTALTRSESPPKSLRNTFWLVSLTPLGGLGTGVPTYRLDSRSCRLGGCRLSAAGGRTDGWRVDSLSVHGVKGRCLVSHRVVVALPRCSVVIQLNTAVSRVRPDRRRQCEPEQACASSRRESKFSFRRLNKMPLRSVLHED